MENEIKEMLIELFGYEVFFLVYVLIKLSWCLLWYVWFILWIKVNYVVSSGWLYVVVKILGKLL